MMTRHKVLGVRDSRQISATSIPHNHHHLKFTIIPDEEYAARSTAVARLHQFLINVQLFVVATRNYRDYCETLRHFRQLDFEQVQALLKSTTATLDLNRFRLNLLSIVRMYLDHTERSIKRRHGESSHTGPAKYEIHQSGGYSAFPHTTDPADITRGIEEQDHY